MVPIVSKLSDIYGRKRQLMITIVGFVAGSMLCGQAQTMNQLIAFRAIQGIAGGGFFALIFTAIADLFTPAERGKWAGLLGSVMVTATVLGPPIGGYLTEQLSWRWVFYVNVPICIIVLAVLWRGYPNRHYQPPDAARSGWRRIDFPGAATLVVAITALLFAVVAGGASFNWLTPSEFGLFALSSASFALFVRIERRAAEPILPLDLFHHRIIALGAFSQFLTNMVYFAGSLYAPLYIQGVIGDAPARSGITLLPQIFAGLAANIATGQVLSRLGRYRPLLLGGSVLMPLGVTLWVIFSPTGNRYTFILAGVLYAIGFSMIGPSLNVAVQNALPMRRLGVGTGTMQVVGSIGQTIGAAVIGALIVGGYSAHIQSYLPQDALALPRTALEQLTDPQHVLVRSDPGVAQPEVTGVPADLVTRIQSAVQAALASGMQNGFIGMLVASVVVATILTFWFPDAKLRRTRSDHDLDW
jgi:EmrB/QacA subfamily drug resistance transporter